MNIWLVNTFTKTPFKGNPASVVIVEDFADDVKCIQLAKELNQVETAFVKIISNQKCHIRWFTPTSEVKMCGHATLAAAHILWEEALIKEKSVTFDSLSGPLHVSQNQKGITLHLPLQTIGAPITDERFAKILGVTPLSIVPVADDFIVEVADAKIVRDLSFNIDALKEFNCRAVIVTSQGGYHNGTHYDFTSRLFAPGIGIPEDAVSGAAHCKLAKFWQGKTGKTNYLAFQASKRSGEILIDIKEASIHITGEAVTVFKGHFINNHEQKTIFYRG